MSARPVQPAGLQGFSLPLHGCIVNVSLLLGLLGGSFSSFTVYPECSPTCLALTISLVMGTVSLTTCSAKEKGVSW